MEGKRTFWLAVLGAGILAGGLAAAFHAGLDVALAERERLTLWARSVSSRPAHGGERQHVSNSAHAR